MHPILTTLLATAAAVPIGWWLRRDLETLVYRAADELDHPHPGPRKWITWTSVAAITSLAATAAFSPDPLPYLTLLPLAITGTWLAAVDLDVMRLPNRVLAPSGALTAAAALIASLITKDPQAVVLALLGALLAGGIYAGIHAATRGGIGYGDVKLAGVIGLALGPLSLTIVWVALLAGTITAALWAKARHHSGPIPYGPWLLLGAWAAALLPLGH